MSYFQIEDGHTGVLFEVLAQKNFEIEGREKEVTVTELRETGGEELPLLDEVVRILPDYHRAKKELEKL